MKCVHGVSWKKRDNLEMPRSGWEKGKGLSLSAVQNMEMCVPIQTEDRSRATQYAATCRDRQKTASGVRTINGELIFSYARLLETMHIGYREL